MEKNRVREIHHRDQIEQIQCPTCGRYPRFVERNTVLMCRHMYREIKEIATVVKDPRISSDNGLGNMSVGGFPGFSGIKLVVEPDC